MNATRFLFWKGKQKLRSKDPFHGTQVVGGKEAPLGTTFYCFFYKRRGSINSFWGNKTLFTIKKGPVVTLCIFEDWLSSLDDLGNGAVQIECFAENNLENLLNIDRM